MNRKWKKIPDARMLWKEADAQQKKRTAFTIKRQSCAPTHSLSLSWTAAGSVPGWERKDESSEVLGQYCGL